MFQPTTRTLYMVSPALTTKTFVVDTGCLPNMHSSFPWLTISFWKPVPFLDSPLNLGEFTTFNHSYWFRDSHMLQFVDTRWKKVSDEDNFFAFQRKLLQTCFSLSLIQKEKTCDSRSCQLLLGEHKGNQHSDVLLY